MIANQVFDRGRLEPLPQPCGGRKQLVVQHASQRTAEPFVRRHIEAMFRNRGRLGADPSLDRLTQHALAHAVAQLQSRRHARGQLDQAVIQKGNTHFQTYRHARAIHLGQDLVGE